MNSLFHSWAFLNSWVNAVWWQPNGAAHFLSLLSRSPRDCHWLQYQSLLPTPCRGSWAWLYSGAGGADSPLPVLNLGVVVGPSILFITSHWANGSLPSSSSSSPVSNTSRNHPPACTVYMPETLRNLWSFHSPHPFSASGTGAVEGNVQSEYFLATAHVGSNKDLRPILSATGQGFHFLWAQKQGAPRSNLRVLLKSSFLCSSVMPAWSVGVWSLH